MVGFCRVRALLVVKWCWMATLERSTGEQLLLLRGNICRKAKQIVGLSLKKSKEKRVEQSVFYVRRDPGISRSTGLIKFENNGLGINPNLCFDFRDGQPGEGGTGPAWWPLRQIK